MPTMLKSSEVQQNFGRVMDQALTENEVIVERYGEPRRYQQLLYAEASADRPYVTLPDPSPEAQAKGREIAAQVRQEFQDQSEASLDNVMGELRGREWSS